MQIRLLNHKHMMGLAVSLRLVMNFKVVVMLLRRLASVIRNMTQGARATQGA
jgi:hypothetical protein